MERIYNQKSKSVFLAISKTFSCNRFLFAKVLANELPSLLCQVGQIETTAVIIGNNEPVPPPKKSFCFHYALFRRKDANRRRFALFPYFFNHKRLGEMKENM